MSPPSICCKADGAPSICCVLRSLRHLQLVCLCGWDLATIYAAAGKCRYWSSSSSWCTSNQFTSIMCRINTERPAQEFHRCARVNARMNTFGARGFWSGCMTPSSTSMHADNNHCIWAYDSKKHRTISAITAFLSNLIFPSISGLTHVILRGLLTRLAAGAVADLVWPWGRVNNCSLRHVCLSETAVLCIRRRRKWHGVPSESVELSNPQGRVYKVFASNRSDDSRQG